jgi:hypothetical protein
VQQVVGNEVLVPVNNGGIVGIGFPSFATCPDGTVLSGGGYGFYQLSKSSTFLVFDEEASKDFYGVPRAWEVGISNTGPDDIGFFAIALCLTLS